MDQSPRRRRFIAYFEHELEGDRARLTSLTGLTHGRVSQLFDERQPFGELAARNLAEKLGLPLDYFEHNAGTDPAAPPLLSPLERDVLRALRALPQEQRVRAVAELVAQAEAQRYIREHAPQKIPEPPPPLSDMHREQAEAQERAERIQRRMGTMGLLPDEPADDRREPRPPAPAKPTAARRRAKSR